MSQTAYRTHHATEVTEQLVGQKVTLAGWVDRRRDHGGVAFIDLRDNTGLVQVVIYDEEMARRCSLMGLMTASHSPHPKRLLPFCSSPANSEKLHPRSSVSKI